MAFSFGFGSGSSFSLGSSNHENEERRIIRRPKTRSGLRRTSSSTTPRFNLGSSSPSNSTSAAPPLFSASSSPSFSDLIIDTNRTQSPESHNKVCSSALDSAPQTATVPPSQRQSITPPPSTTTVSASISTSKVPVEAHTNGTPSSESYPPPTNDSRKKVSTSAPDSAPQFSTLPRSDHRHQPYSVTGISQQSLLLCSGFCSPNCNRSVREMTLAPLPPPLPSLSIPIFGSLHNGNHTAALNSSTATVSASISTSKVPVEAHNNHTNDSRKKASASAPDSAPQFSILPVITLKLMIEKKTNRVVFSESDKDFIDLLFSFLTLPVGTIMRLLEDKSPPTVIGCMNQLYTSVKNLDTQLFITEACKKMLLQLTRLPEVHCNSLKAVIENNLEPSKCFYVCSNSDCLTAGKGVLSDFPNVRCHCGQVMNRLATLMETNSQKGNGGFVKRGVERFLVSDDLKVMPGSTSLTLMLLKDLNIVDANELESQSLNLGQIEILQLLRFSLVSKTPLTYWMQLKQGITFPTELEAKDFGELLDTEPANSESKKMDLKLFFSKCRNEVLYAESGEDFVDFLFSFLTFPLGSILKLLGGKSSLGCVDNLYSSVQNLSTNNYLQSEEIERMLLSPKHAPFSACESQLLDIEESVNTQYIVDSCSNCNSFEGIFSGPLSLVNPKSSSGETTGGGGFVKGPVKFMVTDALAVTLLSPTSITSYLADLNVPITDVGEKDVRVGKNEVLNLLKMALVSGKALTNVFNLGDGQSEHNSRVCNPSCFKMVVDL